VRRALTPSALAARAIARWAMARLPGRAGPERRQRAMLRTADDVARTMGDMKGAAMKLGQVLSLMTGMVPDEFSDRLSTLHAQAPPMSFDLVESVFLRDFGRGPGSMFRSFEREPFAAASIGQVHRATRHDGRRVAVKVQYPGVAEAVDADLANVALMMGLATTVARGLDGAALAAEIREGISAELDYLAEAHNQQRFVDLYSGHPFVVVPAVYHDLTTPRILVQDFLDGRPFRGAREWSQAHRDGLAEAVFRFAFGSIYRYGLFNGDPHPGNYLLLDGGRVGFVDFGCVAEFEPATVEGFAAIIRAINEGRIEDWRAACEDVGILHRDAPFRTEVLFDHMRWFWAPILEDEVRFTRELAAEMVRRNSQATGVGGEINKHCNIPPGMVFLTRINFGLAGVLAGLNAGGPWKGIIGEYVYGTAPVTELGCREMHLATASASEPCTVASRRRPGSRWA
jgi:predicted unusual protein kinase regulating ubiquinone biosynthesis (AarF/ABC1/UbiB family)